MRLSGNGRGRGRGSTLRAAGGRARGGIRRGRRRGWVRLRESEECTLRLRRRWRLQRRLPGRIHELDRRYLFDRIHRPLSILPTHQSTPREPNRRYYRWAACPLRLAPFRTDITRNRQSTIGNANGNTGSSIGIPNERIILRLPLHRPHKNASSRARTAIPGTHGTALLLPPARPPPQDAHHPSSRAPRQRSNAQSSRPTAAAAALSPRAEEEEERLFPS